MAFGKLKKWVEGAVAQVNPFDNGQTFDTVVNNQQPGYRQQAPVQVQQAIQGAKYGVLANNQQAQDNFLKNTYGKTQTLADYAPKSFKEAGTGLGLGGVRSLTGLAQGVSGLYDLATPGTGTNRFSKGLDNFAKFTDQTAQNEGVGNAYKVGQFGTDALTFAAGGALAKGIAKIPQVAKVANPALNVGNKVSAPIVSKLPQTAGGRIAGAGVKAFTNPVAQANAVGFTALTTGQDASKGRDISPQGVATNLAMNEGFNVGLPVAGRALAELPGATRSGLKFTRQQVARPEVPQNLAQKQQELMVARSNAELKRPSLVNTIDSQLDNVDQQIKQATTRPILRPFTNEIGAVGKNVDPIETPLAKSNRLHKEKLARNNLTQNEYAGLHDKVDELDRKASELHRRVGEATDKALKEANGQPLTPKVRKELRAMADEWGKALDDHVAALNVVRKIDGEKPIRTSRTTQPQAVGKDVGGGGTIRPDKTPNPDMNPSIQGSLTPERAKRIQANVDEMKAFLESGKSRYAIDTPPTKKKQATKAMSRQDFNYEAMRIRDNLKAGETGYIKDGNKTFEISRDNNRAKLLTNETGAVGKNVRPQVVETPTLPKTQVQAIPPQPPARVGTQTMTPPPDGPNQSIGQLPAGKTKATRFASKTVPESEVVSEPVKGSIKSPEYSPQTEKQGYANALGRLKQEGNDAFEQNVFTALEKKPGTISRQEAIDATTHAQLLDTKGDDASIRKATEIYEKLSEHYTAAGQTIQVAAIMSRRTPEGMKGWAISTLRKEGVKPSTEVQRQIDTLAKEKKFTELADLVSKNIPSSTSDKIINFWRAGLLTAPTTTGGNLLGNTGEAAVRKGFVNPVATAADAIMGQFTGKRTMTLAKPGEAAKGFKQGAKEFGQGVDATKYDVQKRTNYDTKAVDAYVNGVYKLMGVADTPYSRAAEREALSSIAKAEAINKGLKGKARDRFVNDFMAKPPESALTRAKTEADYAVFKNPTKLGQVASGAKKPAGAVGDFFVPFTQVPSAIATRIVERTPIGIANQVVKQIKHIKSGGEFDQRAMSQAIGNGLFGPTIMGVGFALANNNQLTYGYPTDQKERALWDAEGKQPYSVRIGDRWYSMNYLQPFGTLLAIGGQAADAKKQGKNYQEIIGQGVATAGQSVANQSFLKGISGALDAITDPERSVQKYVEQTSSSVVPNFVRSFARASDPIQRKPEGIVEGVKSGVPGLRESTTPKYNQITGGTLPAKDNFANQYLNPFKPSRVMGDDVTAEIRRLQDAKQGIIPPQSDKNVFGKDSGITAQQQKDVDSQVAKAISDEWRKVIKDPRYQSMNDEDKKKVLSDITRIVSPSIKAKYAAENNFISDKWQPNLDKKQAAYLNGEMADVLASKEKKTAKKTSKVRVARRKSSGRKRTAKAKKGQAIKIGNIGKGPKSNKVKVASAKAPSGSVRKPGVMRVGKAKTSRIGGGKITPVKV